MTERTRVVEARVPAVFRDKLNPKLWEADRLRPEVRLHLLRTAFAFYRYLQQPDLRLADVILVGSSAGYNWTATSDVDLHIVVDLEAEPCPNLAEDFFDTKRLLWNQTHRVTLRGLPVELYVENREKPSKSQAVYSLIRGGWLYRPQKSRPKWDDAAVTLKVSALAAEAQSLLRHAESTEIKEFLDRIGKMRRSGLASGGEYSIENLAYKAFRSLGIVDRLRAAERESEDRDLSL